jgi:hypothetical protein
MQIPYKASPQVMNAIRDLGRTEDIRFSPSNRRLAVAGFEKNVITLLDFEYSASEIHLNNVQTFASECLKSPHGIDFFDEETVLVTNRDGDGAVLRLPLNGEGEYYAEVEPLAILPYVRTPGSVAPAPAMACFR